jgi:hypothetical protein
MEEKKKTLDVLDHEIEVYDNAVLKRESATLAKITVQGDRYPAALKQATGR